MQIKQFLPTEVAVQQYVLAVRLMSGINFDFDVHPYRSLYSITWRCVDVSGSSGHSAGHPDHLAGLAGTAQLGPAGPFPLDLSHVSHYRFPHFFVWMTRDDIFGKSG